MSDESKLLRIARQAKEAAGGVTSVNGEKGDVALTYSDIGAAPASKGVTNGDSHDHSGGDGAEIAFSSLGGRPSTIAGYGITDGLIYGGILTGDSTSGAFWRGIVKPGIYFNSNGSLTNAPSLWGYVDFHQVSNDFYALYHAQPTGDLYFTSGNQGTTTCTWTRVLDEDDIASFQPVDADLTAIAALSGTSGFSKKTAANTWALDTTPLIAKKSRYHPTDGTSIDNATNEYGFDYNTAASQSGITGPFISLGYLSGGVGYQLQLAAAYSNAAGYIKFRTRNGDTSAWNLWRQFWHDGNFDPADYVTKANRVFLGPSATWSTGTATLTGSSTYTGFLVYLVGSDTAILALRNNAVIRGWGGYTSATPTEVSYTFGATVSGDVWTWVAANHVSHTASAVHSAYTTDVVREIRGVW